MTPCPPYRTLCGGSERPNIRKTDMPSHQEDDTFNSSMTNSGVASETKYSFSCLLELAADNDVEGFRRFLCDPSLIAEIGVWYSCQKDSKHMILEKRTPLMIAARYGSVDIVRLIISLPGVDINYVCEPEKSTALHCAASGGSVNAIEVVKILLLAGADPDATDVSDNRPFNVIVAHPDFPVLKLQLQELLRNTDSIQTDVHSSMIGFRSISLPSSETDSELSAIAYNSYDEHVLSAKEKKDYPVDSSLPNIKDSEYSTDEFRMHSFKIRPCSRAYSHDWTECPFVHPGENARRRDPRKFHYSCIPCPEFRKGACKNGDLCEYAHGIFESGLHPAQYRTRLCKDGSSCERRVCFFAHKNEELRPLHGSTGSGPLSPGFSNSAVATMDMASVLGLFPASPCAISALSATPFSPPMSPTNKGIIHPSIALSQQGMPVLNLQTSRLRSSINFRGIPVEELHLLSSPFPSPPVRSRIVAPNFNDLFSTEILSPQCFDQHSASLVFSPTHKSQLQLQQQYNLLSPIRTGLFSPKTAEHPLMESPFCLSLPSGISPRCINPLSPVSCQLSSFAHREKLQQELCSFKSQEFGQCENIDLPADLRLKSPSVITGKVDWSVQPHDPIGLMKSSPKGDKGELPDFSWVEPLIKGSPSHVKTQSEGPNLNSNLNIQNDSREQAILGAWLEQLKLDQIASK